MKQILKRIFICIISSIFFVFGMTACTNTNKKDEGSNSSDSGKQTSDTESSNTGSSNTSDSTSDSSSTDETEPQPQRTPSDKAELYVLQPYAGSLMECIVIKTKNNKLIVIDGGIDSEGKNDVPYLPSALRSILCLDEGEYFEVEAWFLSHAHKDHMGELRKCLYDYSRKSNYKINNFYFDFPDFEKYYAARDGFPAYANGNPDQGYLDDLKTNLNSYAKINNIEIKSESGYWYDDLNGAVINAEAIENGLDITIDDVRFEIMQTWDYGARKNSNDVNETSLVMRAWVEGESILFLNDATPGGGDRLAYKYGKDLKSDIVQMAHHGQRGVNQGVYQNVKADVHIWCTPLWVWNNTDTYEIGKNRMWVNGGVDFTTADEYNIVSCLYKNYPADPAEIGDWNKVIDEMKITLPYYPD